MEVHSDPFRTTPLPNGLGGNRLLLHRGSRPEELLDAVIVAALEKQAGIWVGSHQVGPACRQRRASAASSHAAIFSWFFTMA